MRNSFPRKHHPWSPDNNEDGYISKHLGRYFVLVPGHKKASDAGYILRAHAVWEHHNGLLPKGLVIHHKNGNRLDDRIENLEALTKRAHDEHHRLEQRIGFYRNCVICSQEFYIPRWRILSGRKGLSCGKTKCTMALVAQTNWGNHKKTIDVPCAVCKKIFTKKTIKQCKKRICCSKSCSITLSWKKRKAA